MFKTILETRKFSVTSLGDFSNFLETNILTKVAQTFIDLLDYFENIAFQVKTVVAIFG